MVLAVVGYPVKPGPIHDFGHHLGGSQYSDSGEGA